jgi:hypothetical protein
MDQTEGWTAPAKNPGHYTYVWHTVPGSNHKLRRTARRHAQRLNDRRAPALARHHDVLFQDEKSRRGPFGWHVVKRTRVYS